MSDPIDKELLLKILPEQTARDILSVQPMDPELLRNLYGMSEEELIAQGYKPVSSYRLLWIKNE